MPESTKRRRSSFAPATACVAAFLVFASPSVSRADTTEQTRTLVAAAAEMARDTRVRDGVEALGVGVTFAGIGVASWATPSSVDARKARDVAGGVFVGVGSALTLGGLVSLVTRTDLERARETFETDLQRDPASIAVATASFERALFAAEKSAKTERTATAITSFVFAASQAVAGIAIEADTRDDGLRWIGRSLMVSAVGSVVVGWGSLLVRSETERMADLWRARNPTSSAGASTTTALRVSPTLGMGTVGLVGSF